MNNKSFITFIIAFLPYMNCFAQQVGTLTITATNFKSEKGQAVVYLFREQDDLPKKPFKTLKGSIKNGVAKLVFEDVPSEWYAAIVFHDENANETLDHKLGFPNEPMGFSNNWNLSLFSGMPTFKKLMFEHKIPDLEVAIEVD